VVTTFAPVTDTLNTQDKIEGVFACPGRVHIVTGTVLRRAGRGYTCPYCGRPVTDISDSKLGRFWFAIARPDLGVRK
jgi:predicted RNA-binding Zn-ribbon protein involved in translation (DUF1610 family)